MFIVEKKPFTWITNGSKWMVFLVEKTYEKNHSFMDNWGYHGGTPYVMETSISAGALSHVWVLEGTIWTSENHAINIWMCVPAGVWTITLFDILGSWDVTWNLEIFGVGYGVTVSWSFDFMFEMCMILMDQNLAPLKMDVYWIFDPYSIYPYISPPSAPRDHNSSSFFASIAAWWASAKPPGWKACGVTS